MENIAKLFVKVEETQVAKKKQFVFQWTTYLHQQNFIGNCAFYNLYVNNLVEPESNARI